MRAPAQPAGSAEPTDVAELTELVEQLLGELVDQRHQLRDLRLQHVITSTAYSDLLAAALTTQVAVETGDPDPFEPLRNELPEHPCTTHSTTRTTRTEMPRGAGDPAASTRTRLALAPVVDLRRTP